jgi:hypothetical protein
MPEKHGLYFNKEESKLQIITISKDSIMMEFIERHDLKNEVIQYNQNYYVSCSKIELMSKASELRDEWLKELIEKQHKLQAIRF